MGDIEQGLLESQILDVSAQTNHQESVEKNQGKENCIMKRCGYIATAVNIVVVTLLIIGVILGLLKINHQL